jgi:hypothetical protein
LLAISSIVWLFAHSGSDKVFLEATGGISTLFSSIPVGLYFSAGGNALYLGFLKVSWQDARARGNPADLKKLNDEFIDFRKKALSKPFWSIK